MLESLLQSEESNDGRIDGRVAAATGLRASVRTTARQSPARFSLLLPYRGRVSPSTRLVAYRRRGYRSSGDSSGSVWRSSPPSASGFAKRHERRDAAVASMMLLSNAGQDAIACGSVRCSVVERCESQDVMLWTSGGRKVVGVSRTLAWREARGGRRGAALQEQQQAGPRMTNDESTHAAAQQPEAEQQQPQGKARPDAQDRRVRKMK